MSEEPKLSDFIYEEIRQCERYALLNMIAFEAAIRNSEVKEKITALHEYSDSRRRFEMLISDHERLDKMSEIKEKLKNKYFFDYDSYAEYERRRQEFLKRYQDHESRLPPEVQEISNKIRAEYEGEADKAKPTIKEQVKKYKKHYNLIVGHDNHAAHTHYLSLPMYRPMLHIPQKDSVVSIRVPMYYIHPSDVKDYFEHLAEAYMELIEDARQYYRENELNYDVADEKKSKAETYAQMFFVWDYVQWRKEQSEQQMSDETLRTIYAEVAEIIGANVNDTTGRSAKVEKYLETMERLIEKCGYKQFFAPRSSQPLKGGPLLTDNGNVKRSPCD
jgi:hypothetical protein